MYHDVFSIFPVLKTERLILRKLTEFDAGSMRKYAKDQDFHKFTDYPSDYEDSILNAINAWNHEAYD